jgi:hypothetical protein
MAFSMFFLFYGISLNVQQILTNLSDGRVSMGVQWN